MEVGRNGHDDRHVVYYPCTLHDPKYIYIYTSYCCSIERSYQEQTLGKAVVTAKIPCELLFPQFDEGVICHATGVKI